MEYRVLGRLDVRVQDRSLDLGGVRQRRVLAALLLHPNHAVPVSSLIEAAWDGDPPATAHQQVQNRVAALRRRLTRHGGIIEYAEGPGYLLRVGPDELDLTRFDTMVERGRDAGDAALLRQALDLWRGPALAGLGEGLLRREANNLDERRLDAYEECLRLELEAGEHERLVPELRNLARDHTLRQGFTELLMTALYRCGERDGAAAAYQRLAERLADDFGLDPGPRLRELYDAVLKDVLQPPARPAAVESVTPAQLPADVAGFTGRRVDLARLDRLLADDRTGSTIVISAIAGTAGVGKTALAIRWAHRVRGDFADGQLYVNLRGHAPTPPMRPIDALGGFLRALGVAPERVPVEVDAAAALYRELLAGKRFLVVLDNAADADQVRPLLPPGPPSLALITSRQSMAGLTSGGLVLDVLNAEEAHELLGHVLGTERVAAEQAATGELARLCAYLPLALRIAAANLTDKESIAGYVSRLAAGNRLAALRIDGDEQAAVSAAFSLSHAALAAGTRRMFRLLGLVYGPDITVEAAAALVGIPDSEACRQLEALVAAHLVEHWADGRYACHDLLRLFAAEHADAEEPEADRTAAAARLLNYYVMTADQASRLLSPHALRLPARDTLGTSHLPDAPAALDWLDTELANLTAIAEYCGKHGPHRVAWLLADATRAFFFRRSYFAEWQALGYAGLVAAEADDDAAAQCSAHLGLGDLYWRQAANPTALDHFQRSLAFAREAGWLEAEAAAVGRLGAVYRSIGANDEAIEYLGRAIDLARDAGWSGAEATALANLAGLYVELGQPALAADYLRPAIDLGRRIGHAGVVAVSCGALGDVYRLLGRFDEAVTLHEEAINIFEETGQTSLRGGHQGLLAAVYRDRGGFSEALDLAVTALGEAERTDEPHYKIGAHCAVGSVQNELGSHGEALSHYQRALTIAHDHDLKPTEPEILVGIATAYRGLGQLDDALRHVADALHRVQSPVVEGQAQTELAAVELSRGRPESAIDHATRALRIHRETGYRLAEARTLRLLGKALRDLVREEEAAARCKEALAILADLGLPERA
jgi:DNA-binding SARP family transcriptional activator